MRWLAVAAFLVLSGAAHATDFTVVLKSADGELFSDDLGKGSPDKPCGEQDAKPCLTLGLAAFHALLAPFQDETNLSGEEKFDRGALASRVRSAKSETLSAKDTALVKKLIAKLYGPAVVFPAWSLLDAK